MCPLRLLTGVVVAAGWGALISFLLAVTPGARLPGMLFWLMGDLSDARQPALPLTALGLGLVLAWVLARPLDLLARGELQAAALGVEVAPLRQGVDHMLPQPHRTVGARHRNLAVGHAPGLLHRHVA